MTELTLKPSEMGDAELRALGLDPFGCRMPNACERCGEPLAGEPIAEVAFLSVHATVHAEPCAFELFDRGWDVA